MSDEHDIVEATSSYEATTLGTVAPTPVPAISSNSQETSKKLAAPTAAGSTYLEAVPEETMEGAIAGSSAVNLADLGAGAAPTFHIPESNASDFAPSECSSHYRKDWPSNQLTKTEALSGSQHVVLWLTRTSMSDMPSVPSLKNLVQSSLFGENSNNGGRSGQRSSNSVKPFGKNSSNHNGNPMQRNFSTKSFLKLHKEEDTADAPMRKCETSIALSGMSSSSSTISSSKRQKSNVVKSPLSVFKHLSRSRNLPAASTASAGPATSQSDKHNQQQPPQNPAPPSIAPSEAAGPCESPYPGMQPQNRLRSAASSVICSRCTSVVSVNHSRVASRCTSQLSLHHITSFSRKTSKSDKASEPPILCKICLVDYAPKETYNLQQCHCVFCIECLQQYLSFEIMAGAYEISCPDSQCPKEGIFLLDEIEKIVGKELSDKYKGFRLNTEVALDSNRAWCPKPGCNTICHICASATNLNKQPVHKARAVNCPKCEKEFCSSCSSGWHPGMNCQEYGKKLVRQNMLGGGIGADGQGGGGGLESLLLLDSSGDGNIKQCPMCHVPIERDAGCAQMMCKRCKHVFCWFCLKSLDDDFLLRHYDSGKCKGKLGHTRASLLWHRAQVIGIFAGFVVLLLVASPLLLVAAPCIFCCRCKSCSELEEELDPNSPSKTSRSNSGIAIQIVKD